MTITITFVGDNAELVEAYVKKNLLEALQADERPMYDFLEDVAVMAGEADGLPDDDFTELNVTIE